MRDLIDTIRTGPVGGPGEKIKSGQCISSLAFEQAMTWERLWKHAANTTLRTSRRHPNLLLPGDAVVIPDKQVAQTQKKVDRTHTFYRKGLTCSVQVRFTAFGMPRGGEEFQALNGKVELGKGKLDARGMLEVTIPIEGCNKITVLVGKKKEKFDFEVGAVPPATEPRGIQVRLWNLGYYCGEFSDVFTAETEAALRRFLWKNGLLDENNPDVDAARLKDGLAFLVSAHGS